MFKIKNLFSCYKFLNNAFFQSGSLISTDIIQLPFVISYADMINHFPALLPPIFWDKPSLVAVDTHISRC